MIGFGNYSFNFGLRLSAPSFRIGIPLLGTGGGDRAPNGYGFLAIGSASSYQIVYVGSTISAPRIAIPTGA